MSEAKVKTENKFVSWFKGLKAEFAKIIWPEKGSVIKQTVAVSVITIILSIIIVMIDAVFQVGLEKLLQK